MKCRNNVDNSLKAIEKSASKKTVTDLVKKHENINAIEIVDLEKNKIVSKAG